MNRKIKKICDINCPYCWIEQEYADYFYDWFISLMPSSQDEFFRVLRVKKELVFVDSYRDYSQKGFYALTAALDDLSKRLSDKTIADYYGIR